jgi:hypothetical protein
VDFLSFERSTLRVGGMWPGSRAGVVLLVFFRQRSGDVESGQQSEDIGLEEHDEQFEERHDDGHGEGTERDDLEKWPAMQQHVFTAEDEHQQQQVTGEHIGKESQRQGEWAGDEVRDAKMYGTSSLGRPGGTIPLK